MLETTTIAVAMSGGVDSSTVAAMLRAEGHNVVGLTMQLWNQRRLSGHDGMPEAVRVTLWFDADPTSKITSTDDTHKNPPLVFQSVARLMLADTAQDTASSSSTSDTSSSDQSTPATPRPEQCPGYPPQPAPSATPSRSPTPARRSRRRQRRQ